MKPGFSPAVIPGVVLACVFSGLAAAQSITGSLTGLVSDPTGAAVPSVTVRATNTATGVIAETRTSATGNYVVPNLAPGTYQLEATLTGFKTLIRPGIAVFAGDDLRLDLKLEVGAQQERVPAFVASASCSGRRAVEHHHPF